MAIPAFTRYSTPTAADFMMPRVWLGIVSCACVVATAKRKIIDVNIIFFIC
jgi:hypothetical protein